MTRSPVKMLRHFLEHVAERKYIERENDEIYPALRSADRSVVTRLAELHDCQDSRSPFMCIISAT